PRYVPVAERRRQAAKKAAKLKKAGRDMAPIEIAGRKIASTFWGEAWCKNLEAYSDYANRLPRGRTYVRNGSVIDLQIEAGCVRALVSGSHIYEVEIKIAPLAKKKWVDIKGRCAGQIDSLVELLQGAISKGVMEIVTRKDEGLFPSPREITLNCSCPDWATMCKHVAATLYGVGARLDHEPELLFTLRGVDPTEMVAAAVDQPTAAGKAHKGRVLETDALSSLFGVDIDMSGASSEDDAIPAKPATRKRRAATAVKRPPSGANQKKTAATPTIRKSATSELTAKKAAAKQTAAEKTAAKKSAGKQAAAKTASAEKSTGKSAPKKTTSKKSTARKAAKEKTPKGKPAAKKTGKTSQGK
ncbi:MAG: hypothetical protein WAV08_03810, partial [Desulfobacterales bacterium]